MRILFVENHAAFAAIVIRQFLPEHEVTVVPTVEEARRKVGEATFAAALVDYDLDDGKGTEFVAHLVSTGFAGPIIAVSSHEMGNAALLAAGAQATCPKTEFRNIRIVLARLTDQL